MSSADPIQRDTSEFEWIRNNKQEGLRRLSIGLMFVGTLLYIFGEIVSYDWAVQNGIRALLAGIAGAVIYKLVAYITLFLDDLKSRDSP